MYSFFEPGCHCAGSYIIGTEITYTAAIADLVSYSYDIQVARVTRYITFGHCMHVYRLVIIKLYWHRSI